MRIVGVAKAVAFAFAAAEPTGAPRGAGAAGEATGALGAHRAMRPQQGAPGMHRAMRPQQVKRPVRLERTASPSPYTNATNNIK